jgi:transcriptional regulator with XRE-family HTH domain
MHRHFCDVEGHYWNCEGIAVRQLAGDMEPSGYNRNYISLLECGRNSPSLKTIFNLASCFELKPSEFMAEMGRLLRTR